MDAKLMQSNAPPYMTFPWQCDVAALGNRLFVPALIDIYGWTK